MADDQFKTVPAAQAVLIGELIEKIRRANETDDVYQSSEMIIGILKTFHRPCCVEIQELVSLLQQMNLKDHRVVNDGDRTAIAVFAFAIRALVLLDFRGIAPMSAESVLSVAGTDRLTFQAQKE